MFKKILAYLLAIMTIGSNAVTSEIEYVSPETALLQIFEETSCELEYFNTNSYLIYEKEFITIDIGEKICDDIAEKLNLVSINKEQEELNTYNSVILKGTTKYKDDIVIILQSSKYGDKGETIITLDCKSSDLSNYSTLNKDIRSVMNKLGDATHNTVIVGFKDLKSFKDMGNKKYVEKLFDMVDADVVEEYIDKNVISITGYTNRIEEYLAYSNKKANLNIAIRKDEYNKKSYIYLASPIINIEY